MKRGIKDLLVVLAVFGVVIFIITAATHAAVEKQQKQHTQKH